MKRFLGLLLMFALCIGTSCSRHKNDDHSEDINKPEGHRESDKHGHEVHKKLHKKHKPNKTLNPFIQLKLKDFVGFKAHGDNWKIVGDVLVDRTKEKTISSESGTGILLNTNDQPKNKNLYSAFEHKDIELEVDIMVPLGSNSGIYFQSRYEIQIFDSWNVKKPQYKDMGAIYQRWDKEAQKGKQGYEGYPPRVNVAKAPGLWQNLKVIFHAPKFDATGHKIKNAWFEKVWLNGVLIHENVELSGPTRGGSLPEKPTAPFFIQGDHGPVAFKNLKYRLFEQEKVVFSDLEKNIYAANADLKNLDTAVPKISEKTNKFNLLDIADSRAHKIAVYKGILNVPRTGKYLLETRPGKGDVEIHIENQKAYKIKSTGAYKTKIFNLEAGKIPFKIIYNHNNAKRRWKGTFNMFIEGEKMQRYAAQDGVDKNAEKFDPLAGIIIEPTDKARLQRSFVKHKNARRTHSISVGTPEGTHFSYDLARGSLLKVWTGAFLNTTHMWLKRGYEQLGEPVGASVSMHGDLEFAILKDEHSVWPKPLPENKGIKQLGYQLDAKRMPTFSYELGDVIISNSFKVEKDKREITKIIEVKNDRILYHKIADGEDIKVLPNNTFIVNNEGFYVEFPEHSHYHPIIRTYKDKKELVVRVPKGANKITYKIIW